MERGTLLGLYAMLGINILKYRVIGIILEGSGSFRLKDQLGNIFPLAIIILSLLCPGYFQGVIGFRCF